MITINICAECLCPCLAVYAKGGRNVCIKCHQPRNNFAGMGEAMGDKFIKVILPDGRFFYMEAAERKIEIKSEDVEVEVNGRRVEPNPFLVVAGRKIRVYDEK